MKIQNYDTYFSNEHGDKRSYIPNTQDLELPFYPSTFGRTVREISVSWPAHGKCFIVYSEKGTGRAFVGGRWHTIPEGSVVYFPTHVEIKYEPVDDAPWTTVYVTYAGKAAESILGVNECIISDPSLSCIPEIVDKMVGLFDTDRWFEEGNLLLYSLLLKLRTATGKAGQNDAKPSVSERIKASIKYISEYYCDDLSLSDLAALSGISEEYYCRLFKELTGSTPTAYINSLRITRACDLLLKFPDKKIEDISATCGFRRHSYFNKVFKETVGVTPTKYRSKN